MEIIAFLVLLILILTYLVHTELFFRRLKSSAPDVYAEIGSPSIIGTRQKLLPVLRFFTNREYKQLENKSLAGMGDRLVIHFGFIILLMIAFVVYLSGSGAFS